MFSRPQVRVRRVRQFERPGVLFFGASPDHATLTSYTIKIYTIGTTSPVMASRNIGVPTPDISNQIREDISSLISGLTAGPYTVTILATSAGGGTETTGVNFQAPLP